MIRLSSLGDVILASSALEGAELDSSAGISVQTDWVTAKEYSLLFRSHPRVQRLFEFDRKSGLNGWIQLCRELWINSYDEVIDLHGSLRTRIMKWLFLYWGIRESKPIPRWNRISKQRYKLFPFFFFKSFWPQSWRPTPWVRRYNIIGGGKGQERPNLKFLLQSQSSFPVDFESFLQSNQRGVPGYLCVMPSSRWDGKKWPVESYFELMKSLPFIPVILGTSQDKESLSLVKKLEDEKMTFFSGVGKWDLLATAHVLSRSAGYLGGDTGLAHLAEAVGVSARVIFGPTTPDMGFGPWREESRSIGVKLWCRPCSRDGRKCHRFFDKYSCLKRLTPEKIIKEW